MKKGLAHASRAQALIDQSVPELNKIMTIRKYGSRSEIETLNKYLKSYHEQGMTKDDFRLSVFLLYTKQFHVVPIKDMNDVTEMLENIWLSCEKEVRKKLRVMAIKYHQSRISEEDFKTFLHDTIRDLQGFP